MSGTAAPSRKPTMTRIRTCVCWRRRGTTSFCTTFTTARESVARMKWLAWWGSGCRNSQGAKAGRSEGYDACRKIWTLFRNDPVCGSIHACSRRFSREIMPFFFWYRDLAGEYDCLMQTVIVNSICDDLLYLAVNMLLQTVHPHLL